MSEAMIRHYSKDVNKRRLSVNGVRKLESVWTEMRTDVFGRAVGTEHEPSLGTGGQELGTA